MTDKLDCCCPECGKEITLAISSDVKEGSRARLSFTPDPGTVFPAESIAKTILAYQKATESMLNEYGAPLKTFIERIDTDSAGEIVVTFIYAKKPEKPARPKQEKML